MSSEQTAIDRDRQLIMDAKAKGRGATFWAFVKLSGPGWLQSAITLGGGSLASSLYLGVLAGFSLLWLQPLAMILGIVMLSAISYVTLSTGQRPFQAINTHINPVLGWGWAIATLMANCVWSLPQFSLGTAAVRQNLLPKVFGEAAMPDTASKLIIGVGIMVVCAVMVWFYDGGGRGVKIFNLILKAMVGLIVLSFVGVVVRMSFTDGLLDWGRIFAGFVPDLRLLWSPAETFEPLIAAVDNPKFQDFWRGTVVDLQRDVMISAVATAVGINMTFLLPYSMLRRGWDRHFRGLAMFDLSTGLFIPFLLATSCVVIASAAQFHTQPAKGVLEAAAGDTEVEVPRNLQGGYRNMALNRVKFAMDEEDRATLTSELDRLAEAKNFGEKNARIDALVDGLPAADKRMAAVLVKRDSFNLASSLAPLTGDWVAHYVFGFGVVGMAVSSIIILMLINGFTVCEMLGKESRGWPYRLGSLMPCIGILGPFVWGSGQAQFWLAVPTSIFGMVLLPVAYFSFFLLMNARAVLGDDLPRGGRRIAWNIMMAVAAGFATIGSLWSLWSKLREKGIAIFVAFIVLAVVVQLLRKKRKNEP